MGSYDQGSHQFNFGILGSNHGLLDLQSILPHVNVVFGRGGGYSNLQTDTA